MEEYLQMTITESRKKRNTLLKQLQNLDQKEQKQKDHSSRAMIYLAIAKTHETEQKAETTLEMFKSLRTRRTI